MNTDSSNSKKTNDNASGCVLPVVFVIGIFGVIALVGKGVESAGNWANSFPWYMQLIVGGAIVYSIYKIGEGKNWW